MRACFYDFCRRPRSSTYHHDNDDGTDLDYAMARYYASRSGRFMTPDPGHVGADPNDPQSWNAYVYTANDPVNRTDPSGENYKVCWDQGACFDIEDADYESYRDARRGEGGILPPALTGDWPEDQFVGTITYKGGFVGRVDYYLSAAQRFAREMNKRAEASENLLLVAAGGSVALGVTGGLAANALGLTTGSGLTTLGSVATEQIGTFATKAAARLAIQSLRLNAAQAAAVISAIARATASSTIEIFRSGQDIIVRITRAGVNGYQAISTIIDKTGTKQVVQKAFDAAGKLDHYHIKK